MELENHLKLKHNIFDKNEVLKYKNYTDVDYDTFEINKNKILKKTLKFKSNSIDMRDVLLKYNNSYYPSYIINNLFLKEKPNPLNFIFSNKTIINNDVKVKIQNYNELFIPKLNLNLEQVLNIFYKNFDNKDYNDFFSLMEHFKKVNTINDNTDFNMDEIKLCEKVKIFLEEKLSKYSTCIWLIQLGLIFNNENKGKNLISLGIDLGCELDFTNTRLIDFKNYKNFFTNIYDIFKNKIKFILKENPDFELRKEDKNKILNLRKFIKSANYIDLFNYVTIKNYIKNDYFVDNLKELYFKEKMDLELKKINKIDFIILFLFYGFLIKKLNNNNDLLENNIEFEKLIDLYSLLENNDSKFIKSLNVKINLKIQEKKIDEFDFPALEKNAINDDQNVLKKLFNNNNNINNYKKVNKNKHKNNRNKNNFDLNNNKNKKKNNYPNNQPKINDNLDKQSINNNIDFFNPINKINNKMNNKKNNNLMLNNDVNLNEFPKIEDEITNGKNNVFKKLFVDKKNKNIKLKKEKKKKYINGIEINKKNDIKKKPVKNNNVNNNNLNKNVNNNNLNKNVNNNYINNYKNEIIIEKESVKKVNKDTNKNKEHININLKEFKPINTNSNIINPLNNIKTNNNNFFDKYDKKFDYNNIKNSNNNNNNNGNNKNKKRKKERKNKKIDLEFF